MNSRKFLWGADLSGEAEYFIILGAQPVHSFGLILGHVENPFAFKLSHFMVHLVQLDGID